MIDKNTISKIKPKLLTQLIQMFYDLGNKMLDDLKKNLEESKTLDLATVSHKLKGSCLVIGATKMAQQCEKIKSKVENDELSDLPEMIESLESMYANACSELDEIKKSLETT